MHPALHGALGHAKHARHFSVGQAEHVDQYDRLAQVERKRRNGLLYFDADVVVRRDRVCFYLGPAFGPAPPRRPAQLVHCTVPSDREQPGRELCLRPIPPQKAKGADERVLGHVVRHAVVVDEVKCEPPDICLIPAHELLERAEVAPAGALY
jgi:hypothetical protein